jgi:RNA polymerase sigma-70 factor (ECF subfamily)
MVEAIAIHDLVEARRFGDALDAMYRAHREDVERYVRRRVPAAQVADLCQDVWVAAREALPRYRQDCAPAIWLRVLARNKVIDLWRRRPGDATLDSEMSIAPEVAGLVGAKLPTTPSQSLARTQSSRALARALARLDEQDREMIALRFLDGLKPVEIGIIVGVRPNTVSQRIVRAVRKLRELIDSV